MSTSRRCGPEIETLHFNQVGKLARMALKYGRRRYIDISYRAVDGRADLMRDLKFRRNKADIEGRPIAPADGYRPFKDGSVNLSIRAIIVLA